MHVRKFEADTMDEALKAIKFELGPDAIIVKTVSNAGIKSAFKKKKIEITAAISEDDFQKKKKLDRLLSDEQKNSLYQRQSQDIQKVLGQVGNQSQAKRKSAADTNANTNNNSNANSNSASGLKNTYGQMALNKNPQIKSLNQKTFMDSSSFGESNHYNDHSTNENFMGNQGQENIRSFNLEENNRESNRSLDNQRNSSPNLEAELKNFLDDNKSSAQSFDLAEDELNDLAAEFEMKKFHNHAGKKQNLSNTNTITANSVSPIQRVDTLKFESHENSEMEHLRMMLKKQEDLILRMEQQISNLECKVEESTEQGEMLDSYLIKENKHGQLFKQIFLTLKTFDLDSQVLKGVMDEIRTNFREEMNEDDLWQIALNFIKKKIKVKSPGFTQEDNQAPFVTVYFSEGASGQSSLIYKSTSLVKRPCVIIFDQGKELSKQDKFSGKILDLETISVQSIADLVAKIKEKISQNYSIFVDYKVQTSDLSQTKTLFNTIRKSFQKVEFILSLSSLHTELHTKKLMHLFHREIDYVSFSHVDLCLNWALILNTHYLYNQIPLAHFGNGPSVPKNIISASESVIIKNLFGL